jgi:predicted metal-dependent phosphoesterase TrpH
MALSEKETREMVIDLHAHTFPASPCSSVTVEALIEEAKKIGLDGFCLTDHNHVWDQEVVADLRRKSNFLILRGNEITTDQGDMVVFGLDKEIHGIIKLEALREEVSRAGGFIIVAHPFRGFLTFGIGKLGLTPEKAMERPLFRWVDAVEVMNSKVTEKENAFAAQVAARINRPATGGSDAHTASALGTYATRFYQVIDDEKGLIEALKNGNYAPVAFRRERRERGAAHGKSH